MGLKRKNMEDEMSRFEAEISSVVTTGNSGRPTAATTMFVPNSVRPIIGANTYNQVQQKLNQQPISVPPPPMPPTAFIPTFQSLDAAEKNYATQNGTAIQNQIGPTAMEPSPVVLSSAPKLYAARPSTNLAPAIPQPSPIDISAIQFDVTQKLKKLKAEKSGPNPIAEEVIKAAKASSALQSFQVQERRKKDRKTVRIAGGQVWEDPSLSDWPEDDFRIFCGDLGNDVNDEVLTRTFNKYPSFQRARVIRDKRTGKSKGFGFVSFKEPQDFIKAMKEMDGRYVGSRPIKLRKSTWKQRSLDIVRKKEKEKNALLQLFNKS